MRKTALVAVLFLLVVTSVAQAGLLGDIKDALLGRPEYTTILKDGSAEVSLLAFSDPLLQNTVQTGFREGDASQSVHVLKSARGGWYLRGLVNFSNGSGQVRVLEVELDSSTNFFRPESVPGYGVNQNAWLTALCARSLSPESGDLLPFVTCARPKHAAIQGPVYFVLDVRQLTRGPHKLYVRTMVHDMRSKLAPSEPTINLYVDVEGTPEGDALMRQQFREYGDTDKQSLPPAATATNYVAPPAVALPATPPPLQPGSFTLLDDSPEIAISAVGDLPQLAKQVGYTGPLGRRASFYLSEVAARMGTNVVMFFTDGGRLVTNRQLEWRAGSQGQATNLGTRGWALLPSIPIATVEFSLGGYGRVLGVELPDTPTGLWLPVDITKAVQ